MLNVLWFLCAGVLGFLFGLWWRDRKAAKEAAKLRAALVYWRSRTLNGMKEYVALEGKEQELGKWLGKARENCVELERELRRKGDELDANYHLGKAAGYAAALIELQGRI